MTKNIWTIIKREYLTRIRNKRFLLLTVLLPFILGIFMLVVGKLATYQGDDTMSIAIVDDDNIMQKRLKDQGKMFFSFPTGDINSIKKEKGYDAVVHIPHFNNLDQRSFTVQLYSDKALNFERSFQLEQIISDKIREHKIKSYGIDEEKLNNLKTSVELQNKPKNEEKSDSLVSSGEFVNSFFGLMLGYLIGFVLFMLIIFNGTMVFQSVMEEKTNRIVEVMISTVRPFELMIGKIVGTGAVGITQFLIWALFVPFIFLAMQLLIGFNPQEMAEIQNADQLQAMGYSDIEEIIYKVQEQVSAINWYRVFFISLVYLVFGYLFYASMYAAAGAVSGDDMQQANQVTVPITMLLVLSFYILMATVRTPDSSLAFWSSLIPFSSLIIVPSMSFTEIPTWQILLSISILILSTIGMTMLSARIYRMGILLYGKQMKLKDLFTSFRS